MNKKPDYCPEWFDLDNYTICQSFSRSDWWKAITFRRISLYTGISKDLMDGINREFLINTLIYFSKNNEKIHSGYDVIESSSVEEMKLFDFIDLQSFLYEHNPKVINQINSILNSRLGVASAEGHCDGALSWHDMDFNIPDELPFDLHAALSDNYSGIKKFLNVDLTCSDEKILSDFSVWLKNEREAGIKNAKSQRKTDNDLRKLHEFGILPYIDLFLWCEITGTQLNQYQIANLLFPNEVNVDIKDRLRTVTRPKAMELLKSKVDTLM